MSTANAPNRDHVPLPVLKSSHLHAAHVVQFYEDDSFYLDALNSSVKSLLEAGDAAIIIATEPHRNGLMARWKASGLDIARAMEDGRCILLDATETLSQFMQDGLPDPTAFADVVGPCILRAGRTAEDGHGRVFAFGEMVAVLCAEGNYDAAVALEELWNRLAETHAFTLHCAYPMKDFNRAEHGEYFLRICAEHSDIIPNESLPPIASERDGILTAAYLQQTARALQTEMMERREAEKLLRRSEGELAGLLENAPEGVYQTGLDQRIIWVNKALSTLFGYTAEEFIGRSAAEFYVQDQVIATLWKKLNQHEALNDFPADFKCKDGTTRQVRIHASGLWEEGHLARITSFVQDVTAQKELESELRKAHDDLEMRVLQRTVELEQKNHRICEQAEMLEMINDGLRDLSARLLHVQDEERRHIARDLLDSSGQTLALLPLTLSALELEVKKLSPLLAQGLADNIDRVKQVSVELRNLSYLLHPPLLEEIGLGSALRWFADGFGKRTGIRVQLDLPRNMGRLPRDLEIAVYRVVQECLTNIHRHSGSPVAAIRLHVSSGAIVIEVADHGKGIDRQKLSQIASSSVTGVGLRGMRERIQNFHGDLEIASDSNGTRVKVIIPLNTKRSLVASLPSGI